MLCRQQREQQQGTALLELISSGLRNDQREQLLAGRNQQELWQQGNDQQGRWQQKNDQQEQ